MRHLGGEDFEKTQLPQNFSPNNHDYVSALAIAPSDHNVWYAATAEARLWYSRDHGNTWTESATTRPGSPTGSNGTLAVSADDPFTCFAGGSGYGNPSVWVTHDGGANWSPLSNGLPSTTVWALAFDGAATPTLYAATETGPFVLDGSTWRSLLGGGAPAGTIFQRRGRALRETGTLRHLFARSVGLRAAATEMIECPVSGPVCVSPCSPFF